MLPQRGTKSMYTIVLPGAAAATPGDEEGLAFSQKVITRLRQELGEGFPEVVKTYRAHLCESATQLKDMLQKKNLDEVVKVCAMMESASTQMGANRLARVLYSIRQYTRSGEYQRDPDRLVWLAYEFDYEYAKVKEALKSDNLVSGLPKRMATVDIDQVPLLIAIGDNTTRSMIREALIPEGFVIHEAMSVADALFVLREHDPVAVMLDDLTGIDGPSPGNVFLEIAREIRAASKEIPILVMTDYSDEATVSNAVRNGASDFISRPIYMPILKQRLRYMCGTESSRRKILHMALHDMLTGLPNRHYFNEQMQDAIALHKRLGLKFAVLYVDLDGFKQINDVFGHEVGDQLLVDVASRMKSVLREEDVLARFGGDEFVIIIPGLPADESGAAQATVPAMMLLEALSQPFDIKGDMPTMVTASIGIALFPDHGDSQDALVSGADTMMYRVKNAGKNNYEMQI
jgi:diguanylate cyclase (GGDEF)-like protein